MSRKMTIAEHREKELETLVSFKTDRPTEEDYNEARRIMNSFYRLCGLDWRVAELVNDSRTCDKWSTKQAEKRAYDWYMRLDKEFSRVYGLRLTYCGVCPSIGIISPGTGAFFEKITRFFYD